jgi:hypothetical protein
MRNEQHEQQPSVEERAMTWPATEIKAGKKVRTHMPDKPRED